jgi:hypothetical protein
LARDQSMDAPGSRKRETAEPRGRAADATVTAKPRGRALALTNGFTLTDATSSTPTNSEQSAPGRHPSRASPALRLKRSAASEKSPNRLRLTGADRCRPPSGVRPFQARPACNVSPDRIAPVLPKDLLDCPGGVGDATKLYDSSEASAPVRLRRSCAAIAYVGCRVSGVGCRVSRVGRGCGGSGRRLEWFADRRGPWRLARVGLAVVTEQERTLSGARLPTTGPVVERVCARWPVPGLDRPPSVLGAVSGSDVDARDGVPVGVEEV